MGSLIKKALGALSLAQILTFVVGTVGVFVIENFIPAGELRTSLLALDTQLTALIQILFRKPSASGGSVATR